jgi:AbiU2
MSADIEIFDRLVSHLNYRWKLHKDLFQGASQYDLFNKVGSNVWVVLRESLLDTIFMDISRLLDPKVSSGKDNLSIERLLLMAKSEKYENVLGDNYPEATALYKRLILPWRNKQLSHNDVATLTDTEQTGLPDVSFAKIDELVAKINQVARYICLCDSDTDRNFIPSISREDWTQKLFYILHRGVESPPPELGKTNHYETVECIDEGTSNHEYAKLDPVEEQVFANIGITTDFTEWPAY